MRSIPCKTTSYDPGAVGGAVLGDKKAFESVAVMCSNQGHLITDELVSPSAHGVAGTYNQDGSRGRGNGNNFRRRSSRSSTEQRRRLLHHPGNFEWRRRVTQGNFDEEDED
eukprot:762497-Hanusia_phi.AAC.7